MKSGFSFELKIYLLSDAVLKLIIPGLLHICSTSEAVALFKRMRTSNSQKPQFRLLRVYSLLSSRILSVILITCQQRVVILIVDNIFRVEFKYCKIIVKKT